MSVEGRIHCLFLGMQEVVKIKIFIFVTYILRKLGCIFQKRSKSNVLSILSNLYLENHPLILILLKSKWNFFPYFCYNSSKWKYYNIMLDWIEILGRVITPTI